MEKIVVFNTDKEVSFTIEGIVSATPSLDSISYVHKEKGAGRMAGIDGGFIVVSESVDENNIPYEDLLEYTKQLKISALSQECNEAITQGFEYGENIIAYALEDQQNLSQQLAMCSMVAPIEPLKVQTVDDGLVEFEMYEFVKICQEGEKHKEKKRSIYRDIKEEILNTQYNDVQEIKTIYVSYDE
ncbi:hypothetical protein ABE236_18385 [Priestia endophytica]|uniref:DUF4376 domain-containing protein n=1 Tax=Priestia endophytica TaxID=135735 RepID=UPI003D2AFECB